jgi:hypothetical protein
MGIGYSHPHLLLLQIIDSDDESEAPNAPPSPPLTNSVSISHRVSSAPEGHIGVNRTSSPCNNPPVGHLVRNPTPPKENSPDAIEVKVKAEGMEDQFKYVPFVKSEDGQLDIWNLDGFDLGPSVQVAEEYNRGFSRKVISDVRFWIYCCTIRLLIILVRHLAAITSNASITGALLMPMGFRCRLAGSFSIFF